MIKLLYRANNKKTEALLRKNLNVSSPEIRSLKVLSEKPFVVEVVPRINYLHRKVIEGFSKDKTKMSLFLFEFENATYTTLERDFKITKEDVLINVKIE